MQPQNSSHDPHSKPLVSPDYGFIMDHGSGKKTSMFSGFGSGSSFKKATLVGGVLIAIVIVYIMISSLFLGNKGYTSSFLLVAEQQQEILHFLTTATTGTSDSEIKLSAANTNVAATLKLAIASSQADILAYLKSNGYKLNSTALGAKVSTAPDQKLAASQASGTYDLTFDSILTEQLNVYSQYLKAAYAKAPGPNSQALIKSDFDQAQLMLGQVSSSDASN